MNHQNPRVRCVIPHAGYVTDRRTVLAHRYLRDHGLPHSATIAAVLCPDRPRRRPARALTLDQRFARLQAAYLAVA